MLSLRTPPATPRAAPTCRAATLAPPRHSAQRPLAPPRHSAQRPLAPPRHAAWRPPRRLDIPRGVPSVVRRCAPVPEGPASDGGGLSGVGGAHRLGLHQPPIPGGLMLRRIGVIV